MKWIYVIDGLPESDNQYDLYWVTIQWLDTILDKGEYKNHVQCVRYDKFLKVWVDQEERLIQENEETFVTAWMDCPQPAEIIKNNPRLTAIESKTI